jgi:hypothetical protein
VAQFIVTEFVRGTRNKSGEWEFTTRAEAKAFIDEKVAEGDGTVWHQLAERSRPAGLANLLRIR